MYYNCLSLQFDIVARDIGGKTATSRVEVTVLRNEVTPTFVADPNNYNIEINETIPIGQIFQANAEDTDQYVRDN